LGVILDAMPFQHNGTSPKPIKAGNGYKVAKLTWTYDGKHRNVEEFWVYRSSIDAETQQEVKVLWKAFTPAMALYGREKITNGEGSNGNTGSSNTPQAYKNYFMVEDDDVHLIKEQVPSALKYQVMVRFDDGTVSGLSQAVSPN
jgi:hypothetical protein